MPRDGLLRLIDRWVGVENVGHGSQQFGSRHRFGQIGSHAGLAAARGVPTLSPRGEQNNLRAAKFGIAQNVLCESESIHVRHMHIGDDERKGRAGSRRRPEHQ